MDLTVALRLRATAEGATAIKAMRQETAELAAAMKEVRAAAQHGGQVSPATIKALGGFAEFQKAFDEVQKKSGAVAVRAGVDQEKLFRGRLRMTYEQAKVRAREADRAAAAETQAAARAAANIKREAEAVTAFKMRMWRQQSEAAERAAQDEARAAENAARASRTSMSRLRSLIDREAQPGLGGAHGEGGRHGRGLFGELRTAAGYTLVYGGINAALRGVGDIARAPWDIGKMTLGVADQAREIREASKALGISAREYQDIRYSLAAKGMKEEQIDPMLRFMERNAVAAIRNTKNQAVAFKSLGISTAELRSGTRDPAALLDRVSDALGRVQNSGRRVAVAQMIFGRGGAQYLPLFMGGGLRSATAEAEASGATMTDDQLRAGERLASQAAQLKMQLAGLRNTVAINAMPIVSDLATSASAYLKDHRSEIVKEIKDDFKQLRTDMPSIIAGMKMMADDVLSMGKNIGPFVDRMEALGKNPVVGASLRLGNFYGSLAGLAAPPTRVLDGRIVTQEEYNRRQAFLRTPDAPAPQVHVYFTPGTNARVGVGRTAPEARNNAHRGVVGSGS